MANIKKGDLVQVISGAKPERGRLNKHPEKSAAGGIGAATELRLRHLPKGQRSHRELPGDHRVGHPERANRLRLDGGRLLRRVRL